MTCSFKRNNRLDLLHPVRQWLEAIKIRNPQLGRFLCQIIPAQH